MNFLRRLWADPARARVPMGAVEVIPTTDGGAVIALMRGRAIVEDLAPILPNTVHAGIVRGYSGIFGAPGSYEDLGLSTNTRTNDGKDWQSGSMGALLGNNTGSPATNSSATSLTVTGTPLSANAYKGRRVYADNGTGSPVYGNIGSNTTSAFTVDQWWAPDDSTGSTPSTTAAFTVPPGYGPARFIGLTTDTTAITGSETSLTSELTTNGLARALGTYAHTTNTTSYTLQKAFSATGTQAAIHRAGCFTCLTNTAGGLLIFISDLNADASVANGDTLTVTWTVNI